MKIGELMTTDVITVGPETSLKEAARRMLEAGVSGLPVTNENGELFGIITEADFVATEADRRAKKRAGLLRFFVSEPEMPDQERFVSDVMSTDLVVIGPEADHAEAARLMESERVKRLPVVDDGRLVGLVSRSDMLRAFTRPDIEIIEEIENRVIREIMWIDPKRVRVKSVDGNVVLEGRLDTRTDANLLVELTSRLDGVASVSDHLEWEVDNTKADMSGRSMSPYPSPIR